MYSKVASTAIKLTLRWTRHNTGNFRNHTGQVGSGNLVFTCGRGQGKPFSKLHLKEMNNVSVCTQSCLTLCDPMDCQAPLSMEFSRQEYWSGLSFPSPRDLPNPGSEPGSPALRADSLSTEPPEGLFYISTSPTHEGSTLMTTVPSKGSIS